MVYAGQYIMHGSVCNMLPQEDVLLRSVHRCACITCESQVCLLQSILWYFNWIAVWRNRHCAQNNRCKLPKR